MGWVHGVAECNPTRVLRRFRALTKITFTHVRKNLSAHLRPPKVRRLSFARSYGYPSGPTTRHHESILGELLATRHKPSTYGSPLALNNNVPKLYESENFPRHLAQCGFSLRGLYKGDPPSYAPPTMHTHEATTLTGSHKPVQGLQRESLQIFAKMRPLPHCPYNAYSSP